MVLFGLIRFWFYRSHLRMVTETGQRVRGSRCAFLHGQDLALGDNEWCFNKHWSRRANQVEERDLCYISILSVGNGREAVIHTHRQELNKNPLLRDPKSLFSYSLCSELHGILNNFSCYLKITFHC